MITTDRRRFLGATALSLAAVQLGRIGSASAQPGGARPMALPVKQIDAGVLNVGYAEAGPADGPAVILLHGWPYDIHTYADVVPLLASAGHRVIVPHLRGYGTTRFQSGATPRNGQQAALAVDIVALMDALGIGKATVAGCDWARGLPT